MITLPHFAAKSHRVPSMALDFTRGSLDSRITFTRASRASYFDSAGVLRQATYNLRSYSDAILAVNGYGAASVTLTQESIQSPTATVATKVVLNAGASTGDAATGFNFSTTTLANSTQYTQSIYAKAAESTVLRIRNNSLGGTADFTLTGNGTAPSVSGAIQGASITPVGDGWYRCAWTFTTGTTVPGNRMDYWAIKGTVNDGVGGIYVSGAQFEQASTAGPYYATTTAANGAPRFDYDPVTLAARGLLIEEQRTNLLTYSEQFDNAAWGKSAGTVTADAGVSPDGTSNADLVSSTGGGVFRGSVAVTNATAYTTSVFVKQTAGAGQFSFGFDANPANGRTAFNLVNGTIVSNGANVTSSSITSIGNGWYRCTVTATTTSTTCNLVFYNSTSGTAWLMYGAQLEAGAFATSYIPTTTAQATRIADSAVMTGTNFSSWYNATEGTFFAETQVTGFQTSTNPRIAALAGVNGATDKVEMFLAGAGPNYRANIRTANADELLQNAVALANIYDINKWAIAYKQNDSNSCGRFLNTTDTAVTLPVLTNLDIGAATSMTKYIRRIAYYPRRLSNAELQGITT